MYGYVVDIIKSKKQINYKLKINDKLILVSEDLIEKKLENVPVEHNSSSKVKITFNHDFYPEIMIRHLTKDEALQELDAYIDKAICNKSKLIKIIHGKNGGILRKATSEFLKACPYVESFRLGYPHEGSYGVTIVKLK